MKKIILSMILFFAFTNSYAFSYSLPEGNYQDTCRNCRLGADNVLRGFCEDRNQISRPTALLVPLECRYVENINGHLTCTRFSHRGNFDYHHNKKEYAAGPIWNQSDAKIKCPAVCSSHHSSWTGQWRTTSVGRASICECTDDRHRFGVGESNY